MTDAETQSLIEGVVARDRRSLGRAISWAEREEPRFPALYDALWARTGRAPRLGFTGPPGAGKSTLLSALLRAVRARGESVAVVAVDPTSPFTGGALLGDRVRMGEHALDHEVFIRSMATRGALGGLARRTHEACDLADAFGFDRILVETVGVGQSEHDVLQASDLVVVVLHPGAGDSVQALKAGLTELADLFVVNKADQDGADRLVRDLEEMLELRLDDGRKDVPILRTVATTGDGVEALLDACEARLAALAASGELGRRRRARGRFQVGRIVEELVHERLFGDDGAGGLLSGAELEEGTDAPYARARALVDRVLPQRSA
ncbi:MAG: methylmalonyl Co-A mutase-associated GTPase MeaB [Planctomycetota bacterium]